jgi:hypothetical protein
MGRLFTMAFPLHAFSFSPSPTTTSVGVLGFTLAAISLLVCDFPLSFLSLLRINGLSPAATSPSGLSSRSTFTGVKVFRLKLGLEFGRLGGLIGIISWRCWRDTDICRAIEASAALLRRCSRSSISFSVRITFDTGGVDDVSVSLLLETLLDVVALRERSFGIEVWDLMGFEATAPVEMLDADVDVE